MIKKFIFLFLCVFSLTMYADEEIIVCDNGLEMFHWCLDFVHEAKDSIEITSAYMGGEILRELLAAIEERVQLYPNLRVYLLFTPLLLEKADYQFLDHLSKTYPKNFFYEYASNLFITSPDLGGIDHHVKCFIVDETYYGLGGTNLDDTQCSEGTVRPIKHRKGGAVGDNTPGGVRDGDIVGKGPIAKELKTYFYELYALWKQYNKTHRLEKNPHSFCNKTLYRPLDSEPPFALTFENCERKIVVPSDKIRVIFSGVYQKKNEITAEYVRLIKAAKTEIILCNLYFNPTDEIMKALLAAVNRGVNVTLITNGVRDEPQYTRFWGWANRINYVPLFYGRTFTLWQRWSCEKKPIKKVQIYEYNVPDVILHKKEMIIDRQTLLLGSYNLGKKSHMTDYETVVVVHSSEAVNAALEVFKKDLRFSEEITPEKARGWYFDPIIAFMGEGQKRYHGMI